MFSRVREINRAMFWFNGAALFFASLLPLTLRSIIEHPRDPAAYIVYQVVAWNAMTCMTWFRLAASKMHGSDPGWKEWAHKRNRVAAIGTLQAAVFCALTFVYLPAAVAIYLAMLIFVIVSIDITVSAGAMDTEESEVHTIERQSKLCVGRSGKSTRVKITRLQSAKVHPPAALVRKRMANDRCRWKTSAGMANASASPAAV